MTLRDPAGPEERRQEGWRSLPVLRPPALPAAPVGPSLGGGGEHTALLIWLLSSATRSPAVPGPQGGKGGELPRGKELGEPRDSGGAERRAGSAEPGQSTAPRPASPKHRQSRPLHSLGKSRAGTSASRAPSPEPAPPRGGFSQP